MWKLKNGVKITVTLTKYRKKIEKILSFFLLLQKKSVETTDKAIPAEYYSTG